jgi:beta-glucanase (GH16 family)
MTTRNLLKIFGCCFIVLFPNSVFCQFPPEDKNWEKVDALSDEFSLSSDYDLKWDFFDYNSIRINDSIYFRTGTNSIYKRSNIKHINGYVRFYAGFENSGLYSNYDYSWSYCKSKVVGGYGYYAIRMRIPSTPNHWHCFWLHSLHTNNPNFEIDHVEMYPSLLNRDKPDYRIFTMNTHFWNSNGIETSTPGEEYEIPSNSPSLNADFHVYSFEWLPGKVLYYFDNELIRKVETVLFNGMEGYLLTGLGIHDEYGIDPSQFPTYIEADYIRTYRLKMNYINLDAVLDSYSAILTFAFGVRRNITLGNTSSPITLYTNDNITLRATNNISIIGEFTAPLGSEFCLYPTVSY